MSLNDPPPELAEYYKICAMDRKRLNIIPITSQISEAGIKAMFVKKVYMREKNGVLYPNKKIIGAGEQGVVVV